MNPALIPPRRFVASVTLTNPTTGHTTGYTTVIEGPNVSAAETAYLAAHPDATRVIVRSELR